MTVHSVQQFAHVTSSEPLRVALVPDFDFRSQEFRLLQLQSRSTAFQEPHWLDALYRDLGRGLGAEAATITVRDAVSGQLLLVLPLVRVRRGARTLIEFADFGLSDYTTPIYRAEEAERLTADASLSLRVQALLPQSDAISFTKLATIDPVLAHLFPRARWARMRVSAYAVDTQRAWSEWRNAKIAGSLRRELDLKRRRFNRAGANSFAVLKDRRDIEAAFEALRKFRAHRFQQRRADDPLYSDAVFSFYRKVAIEGAKTGTARTFCLYSAGEPVAVMFGLVSHRTFLLLLVGFDLERFRRHSVGLLAIEDTLRTSVEGGDLAYDFTIGDYSYKTQFGARPSPLYECHVPRTLAGWLIITRAEITREAKRRLKPLVVAFRRSRTYVTAQQWLSRRSRRGGSKMESCEEGGTGPRAMHFALNEEL
jgi:CelD/BcsL family acetyltransferase involved in cellulose biosynthesis